MIRRLTEEEMEIYVIRLKELKSLFNVSEPEMVCVIQMATVIKMLGYSDQLALKCLKLLTAFNEMVYDEMGGHG